MSWRLSQFRAGDLVEVRSKEEILATLDAQGCHDGMPFMPEMLQFCGHRFRIGAVAHKTCEVAHKTYKARRIESSVHLEDVRCDGSAHGGCQAECNLFWKDAWLKPVRRDGEAARSQIVGLTPPGISEAELQAKTRRPGESEGEDPVYSCQATMLFDATEPLAWWDPRQYLRDVITKNHSPGHALRVLIVAFLKVAQMRVPRGYRIAHAIYVRTHRVLMGRELPTFQGRIPLGQPTPTGTLGLKPGDRVRIKSKEEIEATLDKKGRNRGLLFDVELTPYCGSVQTVRGVVRRFIDEATGCVREAKEPCVVLNGVTCKGEYSTCRLMCPRAIPSYWREIWLEKVEIVGPLPAEKPGPRRAGVFAIATSKGRR
jgi:hypothetical protein